MEKLFQILAVILAGIAAYFLWQDNKDAIFVSAVLAAAAYFLSIRFQIKKRLEASLESEVGDAETSDEVVFKEETK